MFLKQYSNDYSYTFCNENMTEKSVFPNAESLYVKQIPSLKDPAYIYI